MTICSKDKLLDRRQFYDVRITRAAYGGFIILSEYGPLFAGTLAECLKEAGELLTFDEQMKTEPKDDVE